MSSNHSLILTTPRLRLEPWRQCHHEGLHAMNGDADVMRYITARPYSPEETLAEIARVEERWRRFGHSWWAFIESGTGEIVGAGCIQHLGGDPNNPLEIGWRIRKDRWRQGLALEAALAMLSFAFITKLAPAVCAICHPQNAPSERLMKKLGMRFCEIQHWHGMDVLRYEISRAQWEAGAAGDSSPP